MATEKKARSISLDVTVEAKLVALCTHLGVNPHAYLLNEIGKCVTRDYLAFQVAADNQKSLNDLFAKLGDSAEGMKFEVTQEVIERALARSRGN